MKKISKIILSLALALVLTLSATASGIDELSAIVSAKGKSNAEEFANSLTVGDEWYVLGLSQTGSYDFAFYRKNLTDYLSKNNVSSASTRLKYALILSATKGKDEYISEILNNSIGKQGIMSYIFGLHMLNNGYKSNEFTAQKIIEILLNRKLADGGYAVSGKVGDVDVTAMVISALTPYYNTNVKVKTAIDDALNFLKSSYAANNGFCSYGIENSESYSAVIIALSGLNISTESFISGVSLTEKLSAFKVQKGYSHKKGEAVNELATAEAFLANAAILRKNTGKKGLYILDNAKPELLNKTETESQKSESPNSNAQTFNPSSQISQNTTTESETVISQTKQTESAAKLTNEEKNSAKKENNNWRYIAVGIVLLVSVLIAALLFLLHKRKLKYFMPIIISAVIVILLLFLISFTPKSNKKITVTVSLDYHLIETAEKPLSLMNKTVEIGQNGTVLDALTQFAKENNIAFKVKDDGYVYEIMGISEFQYGEGSGYIYAVNNQKPSVSCKDYILRENDILTWFYTLDLGNDF